MQQPKLTFTAKTQPFILEAFGKFINSEGVIIEMATGEPVLTPDGEEVYSDHFGGLKKGSEIFIKDDLFSIINFAEGKY